MATTAPLDLSDFKFTAGIDYITLKGLTKAPLPPLNGKAIWPRKFPGRLTVHDATAKDVRILAELFPNGIIDELEVSPPVELPSSCVRKRSMFAAYCSADTESFPFESLSFDPLPLPDFPYWSFFPPLPCGNSTVTPAARAACATPRPMPVLPPTTTTFLPAREVDATGAACVWVAEVMLDSLVS